MKKLMILVVLVILYLIVGFIDLQVAESEAVQPVVFHCIGDCTDSDVECTDDCLDTEPDFVFYSVLSKGE